MLGSSASGAWLKGCDKCKKKQVSVVGEVERLAISLSYLGLEQFRCAWYLTFFLAGPGVIWFFDFAIRPSLLFQGLRTP